MAAFAQVDQIGHYCLPASAERHDMVDLDAGHLQGAVYAVFAFTAAALSDLCADSPPRVILAESVDGGVSVTLDSRHTHCVPVEGGGLTCDFRPPGKITEGHFLSSS